MSHIDIDPLEAASTICLEQVWTGKRSSYLSDCGSLAIPGTGRCLVHLPNKIISLRKRMTDALELSQALGAQISDLLNRMQQALPTDDK